MIYCYATDSGNLQEVGTEAGSLDFLEVVGTGGDQPIGCEGVGGGGGQEG